MAAFPSAARLRELFSKYGKVAVGVHFTVSGISIAGFYVAIKNNVDVEAVLRRVGFSSASTTAGSHGPETSPSSSSSSSSASSHDILLDEADLDSGDPDRAFHHSREVVPSSNQVLVSSASALTLAVLCNKVLLPVRVPITIALTPPVARFLARRKLYKAGRT